MHAQVRLVLVILVVILLTATIAPIVLANPGIAPDPILYRTDYALGADSNPAHAKLNQPGGPLPPCWVC